MARERDFRRRREAGGRCERGRPVKGDTREEEKEEEREGRESL
jgi:hypothetical protein